MRWIVDSRCLCCRVQRQRWQTQGSSTTTASTPARHPATSQSVHHHLYLIKLCIAPPYHSVYLTTGDTTPSSSPQSISKGSSRTKKPLPIPPTVTQTPPDGPQTARTEETDFPPPPDSLLQSIEQELSPPTHQVKSQYKQHVLQVVRIHM